VHVACNAMTKFIYQIVIILFFSFHATGQVKILNPIKIPLAGQLDSIRLAVSTFCTGDTIINSKANFDLRIYRFMAFGDKKLIRITTLDRYNLKIDLYSLTTYKDSLLYHKSFTSWGTDLKTKGLLQKYDILNLINLDYTFIIANSLPRANDGNQYYVEAKVGQKFTFKEFDNPEIYSQHFADKVYQAKVFTNFIKELETILEIKISEPEL
jgi:hypothetical protein